MSILKDSAQVLHVHEQGNTSLVLVLLGRRLGQFRVHAKGGRRWPKKGFEGGFDLLARGEVLVYPRHGEALWLLKEWDERARPALGKDLGVLRAASFLCELSEALTRPTAGSRSDAESEPEPRGNLAQLWDALSIAAEALAAGRDPGPVLFSFTFAALQAEGLLPDFRSCSACGRMFERRAGRVWLTADGVYCEPCQRALVGPASVPAGRDAGTTARGLWLSVEAHRALQHVAETARPVRLGAAAAEQVSRALVLLVHGALEHDLRTLAYAARTVGSCSRRAPAPVDTRAST